MRQPVLIVARLTRIAGFAALLALPLPAGPLGFEQTDSIDFEQSSLPDCGSCAYVMSFEPIPFSADPRASTIVIVTMASLSVIGLIGLKARFRVTRSARLVRANNGY